MTIQRTQTGDVEVKVTVYRDGKKLQNSDGNSDIGDYISGIEIYESITSATMEAKIILADSGGFLGLMTGSELFRIQLVGIVMDKTFYMRAMKSNQDLVLITQILTLLIVLQMSSLKTK